jgi:hypothetical protein
MPNPKPDPGPTPEMVFANWHWRVPFSAHKVGVVAYWRGPRPSGK